MPRYCQNPGWICAAQGYCPVLITSFNWPANFFCLMDSSWPPSKQISTEHTFGMYKIAQICVHFPKTQLIWDWTLPRENSYQQLPAQTILCQARTRHLYSSYTSQIRSPELLSVLRMLCHIPPFVIASESSPSGRRSCRREEERHAPFLPQQRCEHPPLL